MGRFLGLATGTALLFLSLHGGAQVPVALPPDSLASTDSAAQAPPPAAAPAPACPPDVVLLKDGSRFRGTINALVPGSPVTIALVSGEARTFEADTVAYAGPAGQEPPPATTAATSDDDEATTAEDETPDTPRNPRVRFQATTHHTKLLYRVENGYKELCEAPCSREFARGNYEFATRRNPQDKLTVLEDVRVNGDVLLRAKVNPHRGVRSAGKLLVTLGALSAGAGAGYLLLARRPDDLAGYALVLHGFAAISLGFSFTLKEDGLKLSVEEP
jgi:hypothetical protein